MGDPGESAEPAGNTEAADRVPLPVLDLSKEGADPGALAQCAAVKVLAARVDPEVVNAALRVLREGDRVRRLVLVSDAAQLPAAVTELSALRRLEIVAEDLQGLPREIARLEELRTLKVKAFQLGSLPRSIGALRRLRRLSVDSHQLCGLPREVAELAELRHVRLIFRGHLVMKRWGPRPYFRARFEQTLPELFRLLAKLPRLSRLTLGEPPRTWCIPDPLLREIPPEICLLEALETLVLVDCQVPVRLPLEAPELARLRVLEARWTSFVHTEAELRRALPHTRLVEEPANWSEERLLGHWLDHIPSAEEMERLRDLYPPDALGPALHREIGLAAGWLRHEAGEHRAAIKAADRYERSASTREGAIFARLLWADATLSADPDSKDAALAALDKLAPVQLDGLPDVLAAFHWLITARAFGRLNEPDAEREATAQAGRFLGGNAPDGPAILRRLHRWISPDSPAR